MNFIRRLRWRWFWFKNERRNKKAIQRNKDALHKELRDRHPERNF